MSIAPQFFTLDQCEVAPENPRFGRDPRDLDALAATIEARGILQPLIGYQEGGKVFICAGARRLAAIAMLTVEGRAPAAFETDGIPIRIVAKEDAAAIGLIEQSQRNALHPAEATRRRLGVLGRLAKADPAWCPLDADWYKGASRGALDDWAKEMGLDAPAAMKKGALAQLVADKAAELKWQPPLLREMIGAPKFALPKAEKPAKATKAEKKTAKTKAAPKGKGAKPKAARTPAIKPGAAGRSGRVFKTPAAFDPETTIDVAGAPAKKTRGRPSKAELARRAALSEAAE